MEARLTAVPEIERRRVGLRAMGAGLGAALMVGAAGGYLAATLTGQHGSTTAVPSQATVAAAPAGPAGAYGDHDSRLPLSLVGGAWGDHDSRVPLIVGPGISLVDAWGDHDSRPPQSPFTGR